MFNISFTSNNTLNSESNVEKKKFHAPGFERETKEWMHKNVHLSRHGYRCDGEF